MNKYQKLFIESLDTTQAKWAGKAVDHKEVYRFLHSVRGTAGTLGLHGHSVWAEGKLAGLDEETVRTWQAEELEALFAELESLKPGKQEEPMEEGQAVRKSADVSACGDSGVGGGAGAAGQTGADDAGAVPVEGSVPATDVRGTDSQKRGKEALVLVVDDDILLLQAVKEALEAEGWMVLAVPDPTQAERLFFEMNPDCVLLDIMLEEKNGFDVLSRIAPLAANAFVPVMMMSGKTDKATRIRCYKEGADAFCEKPVDLEELVPRIGRLLFRRLQLKQLLLHDPLTGAYTRMFYGMEMQRRRAASLQSGKPGGLYAACLDIDGFGEINEFYGHPEGNRLLCELVRIVRSCGRTDDVLIRDHGDRFFLLMEREHPEEALETMEQALRAFKELELRTEKGTYSRTLSIGLGAYSEQVEAGGPEALLDLALRTMLAAKAEGGGVVRTYSPDNLDSNLPLLRVAVVDDDPLLCKMLLRQLSDIGGSAIRTEIRSYPDGEQFLEDTWHSEPGTTIVVLDRLMPRMNGMEVLRRLRASYDRRKYRIVMLTGVNADQDIASAIEEGTDDYLTKPFSLLELEARLKRYVRGLRK